MKVFDMIAYSRKNLRKSQTEQLRREGQVPSVVYGGGEVLHTAVPAILFRKLLSSDQAHFVRLNLEGRKIDCILQDVQYHPVAGHILHADFLVLSKKQIKMYVPLHVVGQAPGLLQGGKLQLKMRKVQLRALPEHIPSQIDVDVSELDLGQSFKVGELPKGKYEILDNVALPVVSMAVPKALRSADAVSEAAEAEVTETEEETTEET